MNSQPVPEAVMQVEAMKLPPQCLIDELVYSGSGAEIFCFSKLEGNLGSRTFAAPLCISLQIPT